MTQLGLQLSQGKQNLIKIKTEILRNVFIVQQYRSKVFKRVLSQIFIMSSCSKLDPYRLDHEGNVLLKQSVKV